MATDAPVVSACSGADTLAVPSCGRTHRCHAAACRWLKGEIGRDDISVIPNGANTDLFRPDAPRPSSLPERYVVFVGALAVWQGIDTAIAAANLPEWPSDVSLVIAGDGAVCSDVEAAANTEERVVYLGVIPYEKVPGVLANSVAGLSPQSSVGERGQTGLSPLKLYEMASCATPVIVSDYPGLSEFVREHECGLGSMPRNDPRKLAAAVARLAADSDEASAMGACGRTAVTSLHSWDAHAPRRPRRCSRKSSTGTGSRHDETAHRHNSTCHAESVPHALCRTLPGAGMACWTRWLRG